MTKVLPPDEYYACLHKVPVAAGALIRNSLEEILIVKPNYREGWLIPGGAAEADESPKTACYREVLEEVGLDLGIGRLLCVDYRALVTQGAIITFLFDGGVISNEQISSINLQVEELDAFVFATPEKAFELCADFLSERMRKGVQALKKNETYYLENQNFA